MGPLRFSIATVLAALLLTAISAASARAQTSEDLAKLNERVAQLHQAGKYEEAIPIAHQALVLAERLYGPGTPLAAAAITKLAALYGATNQFSIAELLYERAAAIYERSLGPNHPDTIAARTAHTVAEINAAKRERAEVKAAEEA